jgi:hypothetical protein
VSTVAKTRFRYTSKVVRVGPFLRSLGVKFKPGRDFWTVNRHLLPAIYAAMQDAARDKMRELHPDRGGDGHEFDCFLAVYRGVKKAFLRAGLGASEDQGVRFWPRGTFQKRVPVSEIASMIENGFSVRQVAKATGSNRRTIVRVQRLVCPQARCRCGRPTRHIGLCSDRQARPRWTQTPYGRRKMSKLKTGVPRDPKTRATISATLRRRYSQGFIHPMKNVPRSPETRAKIKAACNRPEAIAKMSAANKGRPKK